MKKLFPILLLSILLFQNCNKDNDVETKFENWTQINIGTEADLTKVFFIDDKIGFVAAKPSIDSVYISTEREIGYNYLFDIPTIFTYSNTTKGFTYDARFVKAKNPQPSFFKTTDAGKTWTIIHTPFDSEIQDMFFIDENVGFVTTKYEGAFKTEDGGSGWTKILASFIFPGNLSVAFCTNSTIRFFNKLEGYIYIDDPNADMIIHTQDGGLTWKFISNSADNSIPNYNIKKTKVLKDNTAIFNNYANIYRTSDQGNSWKLINTPNNIVLDATFITKDLGYYASNGEIFKTENGGEDWEILNYFNSDCIELTGDLFAFSTGDVFTTNFTKGEIYISDNSTKTFKKILSLGNLQLNDVCFPSDKIGFALGNKGKIFRYSK